MKEIVNNTRFDIDCIKDVIRGRVDPFIYAFKTNTVPSYLKIGDTYRDVDIRLAEWNELYKDIFIFKENGKRVNPIINESAIIKANRNITKEDNELNEKNNIIDNNDIYFRDYSIHEYLKSII